METTRTQEPTALVEDCCPADALPLSTEAAQQFADDLMLIGHPIRIQILMILARNPEPVCVCEFETALPVKQPTVSHHLRLLREGGLIDVERRGLFAYYFIRRAALAALRARISLPLDQLA